MKYIVFFLFVFILTFSLDAKALKELRIATYIEEPFSYIKNNRLVGENIEIAKVLAESLNLEPIFIHCPFARCLAMVKNGHADMIFGLRRFPEREINLTFISPPYVIQYYPLRFFTLKSANKSITKFSDLQNLTVGTLRGATYFDQFDKNTQIKKIEVTTREQLVNMLLKNRFDTFLDREESIEPLLSQEEYNKKFSLAKFQYDKADATYIAISKLSRINNFTKELKQQLTKLIADGTIGKIIAKRIHAHPKNSSKNQIVTKM